MSRIHLTPLRIMLIEDNPGDIRLAIEALREGRICNELETFRDAAVALAHLRASNPYDDNALPDLILLDLNMPKMGGLEFLTELRTDERLNGIPVIVLTSSQRHQDVLEAQKLHAKGFITKPIDLPQIIDITRAIDGSYLCLARQNIQ